MGLGDGSPDKLIKVLKNLIVMLVRRRGAPALELPSKFIHSTLMISKSPLKLIPKDLCHQFSFHLTNMSTSVVDVKLLQKVIAKKRATHHESYQVGMFHNVVQQGLCPSSSGMGQPALAALARAILNLISKHF